MIKFQNFLYKKSWIFYLVFTIISFLLLIVPCNYLKDSKTSFYLSSFLFTYHSKTKSFSFIFHNQLVFLLFIAICFLLFTIISYKLKKNKRLLSSIFLVIVCIIFIVNFIYLIKTFPQITSYNKKIIGKAIINQFKQFLVEYIFRIILLLLLLISIFFEIIKTVHIKRPEEKTQTNRQLQDRISELEKKIKENQNDKI